MVLRTSSDTSSHKELLSDACSIVDIFNGSFYLFWSVLICFDLFKIIHFSRNPEMTLTLLLLLPNLLLGSPSWWNSASIYQVALHFPLLTNRSQVYPLSLKDSDGDGYGDLAGLRNCGHTWRQQRGGGVRFSRWHLRVELGTGVLSHSGGWRPLDHSHLRLTHGRLWLRHLRL